ncbi:MAG: electron transport complex subunit RsxC [Candidatus Aminicenantaceae bacterium]
MKLKTFPKGTHPPELKDLTAKKPLESIPPPEKVFIPLLQHFGSPAESLVSKGDEVCLGQKIGECKTLFSASVHSSVSGKVLAVDNHVHPGGSLVNTITIANDGQDRISPEIKEKGAHVLEMDIGPDEIRHIVKEAGIVGLGGAAFPTAVKLTPPKDKTIDTIIINGCECEPMLTADSRLMLEYPEDILYGAEIIRLATGAERIIVGIEDNKIEAFKTLKNYVKNASTEIALLKTKYPQGAEKNLIYALLKREVPRGGLPFDVGIVVQNVGTSKAIGDAVKDGIPLHQRAITVSGSGIKDPKNVMVRIGTPFKNVIEFCGGLKDNVDTLIMGGPMMGISQWSLDVPVIKGTSGILAWTSSPYQEYDCIRCSRCVDHCPMGLVPTQLMKCAKYENLTEAENWGILDCVECGCCQYSCPAKIPLVHWIRFGKNKTISLRRKKSA